MRRCQRSPRSITSTTMKPPTARIQPGAADRRISSVRPGSTERSTSHRATSEMTAPMRARSAADRFSNASGARRPRVAPASGQLRRPAKAGAVEQVAEHDSQRRQPVDDAAPKVDGARLLEVPRRDADLADPSAHARGDDLRDELLVEHEVVAVQAVRDRLEKVTRVRSQPRVILAEPQPEGDVLDERQEAVADVLPLR